MIEEQEAVAVKNFTIHVETEKKKLLNNRFTAAPVLIFALTALFSSICFIFDITNITFSLILSVLLVAAAGIIFDRKILISCMITVAAALLSIKIAGHIYDISYDGMYFHKEAVYSIANGWNPLKTSFWYFDFFGKMQDSALWLDNYPKGVWSFYACIYRLLGKIEYAKGANIVFVLMLFFAAYDTISEVFDKRGVICFLLAAVFTANPVIASQYFTYMNDLPVAVLVMVCAFLGMKIYADRADTVDYICLAAVFSSSFTVKFTAPVFCGCILIGFGVAVAIKNKGKNLIKPCIVVISAAVIGITLMGADPYMKHIAEGKNILYPVMGEGKYDIMNTNAPEGIDEMSNPAALVTSLFSCTSANPEDVPVLKIPFSVDTTFELWAASAPDARMGGFGIFFSGILVIAIVIGIFALFRSRGVIAIVPALIVFTLLALFFPESWWARYNPYIYYIPCLILLAFSCADKTRLAVWVISLMILLNSGLSGILVTRNFYRQTRIIKWQIFELQKTGKHILFCINDFPCHEIWFNEHDMDFELVTHFHDGETYNTFYQTTLYQLQ